MGSLAHIRNFSIIAHIDHGKSTLADRLLLLTGTVMERDAREQMLDAMDLERERGITIKAKAVRLVYRSGGREFLLNLIDTPGHVDFHYEVSRSLAACEGALLLVDAAQGVEAQTVANAYLAIDANLEIIPVLNKVDLGNARPDEVAEEIESSLGIGREEIFRVSAKTGLGVPELIEGIIARIPPPQGDPAAPLRALIFDSTYDTYRGVIIFVRLLDGTLKHGQKIYMLGTGRKWEVDEVGFFRPHMERAAVLSAGEVGYVIANIKGLTDVKIGDTITTPGAEVEALPGYRVPHPMVYCGLYPTQNKDYPLLRQALEKLQLNDSSFTFVPESSEALGFGFRCGFLGLLHMEIVQERLERESNLDLVQTAPNVTYEILTIRGEVLVVDSPAKVPDPHMVEEFREPIVEASIIAPSDCIGTIMKLNEEYRGRYVRTEYVTPQRVILVYHLPLAEIIYDYYDKLKSATRGYGTLDYELRGYEPSKLARLRILVNDVEVDALSSIVHQDAADRRGRELIHILKKKIPRHLFQIPLQAAIGGRIIARENISPLRKNVTAKCYGGDVTRKRKLLEKQKEGKKRMKSVGNVEIPQEAFLAALQGSDAENRKKRGG